MSGMEKHDWLLIPNWKLSSSELAVSWFGFSNRVGLNPIFSLKSHYAYNKTTQYYASYRNGGRYKSQGRRWGICNRKWSHPGWITSTYTRDRAVENWLLEQVVPAYDALKADPSRPYLLNRFVPGLRLNIRPPLKLENIPSQFLARGRGTTCCALPVSRSRSFAKHSRTLYRCHRHLLWRVNDIPAPW